VRYPTHRREIADLDASGADMTTLTTPTTFIQRSSDFVSTDIAALASHMDHCASKRSRFFGLHAALELVHSVVFSRIVTAAVLSMALLALVGIV